MIEVKADLPLLQEALADYAHRAWSGWMEYLFANSMETGGDGSVGIPAWAVERWTRQAETDYADLPENEKESDRKEAKKILAIVQEHCRMRREIG